MSKNGSFARGVARSKEKENKCGFFPRKKGGTAGQGCLLFRGALTTFKGISVVSTIEQDLKGLGAKLATEIDCL